LEIIRLFNEQLAKNGGPFLMGEQFTLVDIALLPFCERMNVLFSYYKNFEIPKTEEYSLFHEWMKRGFQRESFIITSADRSDQSMRMQPFKNRKRLEYLREVYAPHATNKLDIQMQLLANSIGPESAIDWTSLTDPAKLSSKNASDLKEVPIKGLSSITTGKPSPKSEISQQYFGSYNIMKK